MFNDYNEINEIYLKADELFKLRIKQQIKGSGLFFERIYKATDLLSSEEFFSLVINNNVIYFKNIDELYFGILEVIKGVSKQIEYEIDFFENHKKNDLNPVSNLIYNNLETLFHRDYKLSKLKKRILKLSNDKR